MRGFTYIFNVNASGHPFWIKTSATTGTGNAYSSGVTNNGTASGSITFAVPYNAPNTLYYICQYHSGMVGTINISDAGPKGEVGDKGAKGEVGSQGIQGEKGVKGDVEAAGNKGEPGDKGNKGDLNDKGQKGEIGSGSVPSGAVMLFYQASAPTGWTQVTSGVSNKALRVVDGTGGGSGGSNSFTSTFENKSISVSGSGSASGSTGSSVSGSTSSENAGSVSVSGSVSGNCSGSQYIYASTSQVTLATSQIPSHAHQYHAKIGTSGGNYGFLDHLNAGSSGQPNTNSTGGSGAHNHSLVNYQISGSNFSFSDSFSASGSPSNHSHDIGNHSHSFSDSVSVSSSGSVDLRVQYVDVIICSKD